MPRHLTAALLLLCTAAGAHAQYARAEATYASPELVVRVVMLDPEAGTAAASATVTRGACSASLAGVGTFKGRSLELTPHVKQPRGEACRLVLTFDAQWQRVQAADNGACSAYQGAGCGWEGQSAQRSERGPGR